MQHKSLSTLRESCLQFLKNLVKNSETATEMIQSRQVYRRQKVHTKTPSSHVINFHIDAQNYDHVGDEEESPKCLRII